ncbi:hypothetical protein C7S20_00015 [Christiangramia fulva]|uniref:Uncharacterized protein n=1 Tax=Christiangramia fulva TaxID=2126553 RepID=A0A2R3Z0I7_9FLAO|nr:hypothetical protein C7S20_00015 [Christiangramia fulva]
MPNVQCNDTDVLCPVDCATAGIPTVNFDDCSPENNESEIEWIAISRSDSDDFADVEDATEWTTRIAQTAADPAPSPDNSIRMIRVIGDKPAPEVQNRTVSGGRQIQTAKNHTLNVEIDETNSDNYEFIRSTQCNPTYKLWYITRAGLVYGGICGIKAQAIFNLIQNRGDGEIEKYVGTVTWKDRIDPPRANFPLAGEVNF